MKIMAMMLTIKIMMMTTTMAMIRAYADDTNPEFSPCSDAKVQKSDGFTFGIALSSRDSFFFNQTQLSPCDKRLPLSGNGAQLAVFRPKVDEISLLTISNTTLNPGNNGGVYMVAFAGRNYAARSFPTFVGDNSKTITSFTLVLEFKKGVLENLYWKNFGCGSCTGESFTCVNNTNCAVLNSKCKGSNGGSIDCSLGIQLAFSGTDKRDAVLNSWYEVSNLRQYSLFGLYSNIRDSLTSSFSNMF